MDIRVEFDKPLADSAIGGPSGNLFLANQFWATLKNSASGGEGHFFGLTPFPSVHADSFSYLSSTVPWVGVNGLPVAPFVDFPITP